MNRKWSEDDILRLILESEKYSTKELAERFSTTEVSILHLKVRYRLQDYRVFDGSLYYMKKEFISVCNINPEIFVQLEKQNVVKSKRLGRYKLVHKNYVRVINKILTEYIPVSKVTNLSYNQIRWLISLGKLRYVNVGKMKYLHPEDFNYINDLFTNYMTTEEVAKIVHYSRKTISKYCRLGKIPCVRFCERYFIKKSDIPFLF